MKESYEKGPANRSAPNPTLVTAVKFDVSRARRETPADQSFTPDDQARASRTMLVGVSAARRMRLKPASPSTAVSRFSPACAPSARPTS